MKSEIHCLFNGIIVKINKSKIVFKLFSSTQEQRKVYTLVSYSRDKTFTTLVEKHIIMILMKL